MQLEDPIAAHIDPILWALNHSKLQQHFGAAIDQVQIQQLRQNLGSEQGPRMVTVTQFAIENRIYMYL